MSPFRPRVALASLSGRSDASWASAVAEQVGAAFLGGIALDRPTRAAASAMVERDRREFLPPDPVAFVEAQLRALAPVPIRPAVNVRAVDHEALASAARVCARHDAICEVNAHCRQAEMCDAGAGQRLLGEPDRLAALVETASDAGATVSVKVRTEVPGVDLPRLASTLETAGADVVHVDAMDSEPTIRAVSDALSRAAVIANNGVRDGPTTRTYLEYGADAVSVGRASDDPAVLARVRRATQDWFAEPGAPRVGAGSGPPEVEP